MAVLTRAGMGPGQLLFPRTRVLVPLTAFVDQGGDARRAHGAFSFIVGVDVVPFLHTEARTSFNEAVAQGIQSGFVTSVDRPRHSSRGVLLDSPSWTVGGSSRFCKVRSEFVESEIFVSCDLLNLVKITRRTVVSHHRVDRTAAAQHASSRRHQRPASDASARFKVVTPSCGRVAKQFRERCGNA